MEKLDILLLTIFVLIAVFIGMLIEFFAAEKIMRSGVITRIEMAEDYYKQNYEVRREFYEYYIIGYYVVPALGSKEIFVTNFRKEGYYFNVNDKITFTSRRGRISGIYLHSYIK